MDTIKDIVTSPKLLYTVGGLFATGFAVGAAGSVKCQLTRSDNSDSVHTKCESNYEKPIKLIHRVGEGAAEAGASGLVGGLYLATLPVSYPAYTYFRRECCKEEN